MRITALAGGVGSARFLSGMARVVDASQMTVIVNTGDDERIRGLHVSPDVDTVLYHLGGRADWQRGWGILGDTFTVQERYATLVSYSGFEDAQEWFGLGDTDLATHMLRSRMLDCGLTLSDATRSLARACEVRCTVLPMSDDEVRTELVTLEGERLTMQEYFVARHQQDEIREVAYLGSDAARPASGVLESIAQADVVVVPPSNPILSVAPVLSVPGVREALASAQGKRLAVSPIIAGRAVKGPAGRLLASLGHEVSALGVARMYQDLVDVFVLDEADSHLAEGVAALGMSSLVTDTMMRSAADAARLVTTVLGL